MKSAIWLLAFLLSSFLLLFWGSVHAGDWPGWRGPTGQGIADVRNLPLEWGGKSGSFGSGQIPGLGSKPGAAGGWLFLEDLQHGLGLGLVDIGQGLLQLVEDGVVHVTYS